MVAMKGYAALDQHGVDLTAIVSAMPKLNVSQSDPPVNLLS